MSKTLSTLNPLTVIVLVVFAIFAVLAVFLIGYLRFKGKKGKRTERVVRVERERPERGSESEPSVRDALNSLDCKKYVLSDFCAGAGESFLIDHILICPYGVFLIEVKDIAGEVYGNENSKRWFLYRQSEEQPLAMENPVKQISERVDALKDVAARLSGVVVMARDNVEHISAKNAVAKSDLTSYIKSFDPALTGEEMEKIYSALVEYEKARLEKVRADEEEKDCE